MNTESKPAESQSVSLKPVLIAMIVAAALPLLICSGGFLEVLSAPLTGGAMITIALGLKLSRMLGRCLRASQHYVGGGHTCFP